jgi:hypothetical protein
MAQGAAEGGRGGACGWRIPQMLEGVKEKVETEEQQERR